MVEDVVFQCFVSHFVLDPWGAPARILRPLFLSRVRPLFFGFLTGFLHGFPDLLPPLFVPCSSLVRPYFLPCSSGPPRVVPRQMGLEAQGPGKTRFFGIAILRL